MGSVLDANLLRTYTVLWSSEAAYSRSSVLKESGPEGLLTSDQNGVVPDFDHDGQTGQPGQDADRTRDTLMRVTRYTVVVLRTRVQIQYGAPTYAAVRSQVGQVSRNTYCDTGKVTVPNLA